MEVSKFKQQQITWAMQKRLEFVNASISCISTRYKRQSAWHYFRDEFMELYGLVIWFFINRSLFSWLLDWHLIEVFPWKTTSQIESYNQVDSQISCLYCMWSSMKIPLQVSSKVWFYVSLSNPFNKNPNNFVLHFK